VSVRCTVDSSSWNFIKNVSTSFPCFIIFKILNFQLVCLHLKYALMFTSVMWSCLKHGQTDYLVL
jgi:hypothetical protein